MKTCLIIVASLSAVLASCSKSSDSDSKAAAPKSGTAVASAGETAETTSMTATDNPCELLTEAIVRKHLELAEDVEMNQRLSKPGGFPHCSYNWSTLTPEEEKERNAELAKRAIASAKSKGAGQGIVDMAMSQNSGTGSAHLTMAKEMDSEAAAIGALASARTFMENRAKTKADKNGVDFTSPFVDVEGVGAKAHYSNKQQQLSFVHGKRLFHLGVKSHAEGNGQELAKTIANEILK